MKFLMCTCLFLSMSVFAKVELVSSKPTIAEPKTKNVPGAERTYPGCNPNNGKATNKPCYWKDKDLSNGNQSGVID